eukprot:GDKI01030025.1.p1 GENE.GDKI01030025.1~~GDKI01030025.1.p1  ORF type:complete len:143 (+),score=4.45 GDKI01030025.1:263-691(+)
MCVSVPFSFAGSLTMGCNNGMHACMCMYYPHETCGSCQCACHEMFELVCESVVVGARESCVYVYVTVCASVSELMLSRAILIYACMQILFFLSGFLVCAVCLCVCFVRPAIFPLSPLSLPCHFQTVRIMSCCSCTFSGRVQW